MTTGRKLVIVSGLLWAFSLSARPSVGQEFVSITEGAGYWFGLTRAGDVYRFQIPFGPGEYHGSLGPGVWVDIQGSSGPLHVLSESGDLWEMSMGTNATTNLLVPSPAPGPWVAWSNQYALHANGDIWNLWPGSPVVRIGSFIEEPPVPTEDQSWGQVKRSFTKPDGLGNEVENRSK